MYNSIYIKYPENVKLQRQKIDWQLPMIGVGTIMGINIKCSWNTILKWWIYSKTDQWWWLYNLVNLIKKSLSCALEDGALYDTQSMTKYSYFKKYIILTWTLFYMAFYVYA